jgi:hypothetical protein
MRTVTERSGETVCRLNRVEVLALVPADELLVSLVPGVERGEVLVGSRGQESFQRSAEATRK